MPIELSWDEDMANILVVDITLPWDWKLFHAAVVQAVTMMAENDRAAGIMVDVRQAGSFPPAGFIQQSRYALNTLPALNMAFVANTSVMEHIFQPIMKLLHTRRHFYFVDSREGARIALTKR